MEDWFQPHAPSALPPARRVLVLAPHPDDEVFGCGGCIALYARDGATVEVRVLTDGGGYLSGAQREAAVRTRQDESRRAAALLGVAELSFESFQDRGLSADPRFLGRLNELIDATSADVIFAPSLWEVHPDHRVIAWALVQACLRRQAVRGDAPLLAFFEVGAPQRPNCLIDISAVAALKKQAMGMFESQLAVQPYDRHITALNVFRTYALPGVEAAEGLCTVAPHELAAWADSYGTAASPGLGDVTESALKLAHASVENLQQSLTAAQRMVAEQRRQIASLDAMLEGTRAELERTRAELAATVEQRNSLQWERDHVQAERDRVTAELQAMQQSRSWRYTRPLRWLMRRLRRQG